MGDAGERLAAAAADLAAADARYAELDALLAELVGGAYRTAVEAIARLDAVHDRIAVAVASRRVDTPAAAREFAAFLLDRNREITEIVAAARAEAGVKTAALQALTGRYTG